uniref:Gamma-aminobutyrate metabolism dehydratase/isomerase n=1 Tax=Clostridioides difficile TaxID=1496 RepID=A0A381IDY5_CLODI|nr:gamma-aminobutyrate metabolism dehydratase/isomerase [Clostridioides difficile]
MFHQKVTKQKLETYQIDLLLANVCKQNVTRFPYEIVRLAEDIAGGLMVTMPSEKDFKSDLKSWNKWNDYWRSM